MSHLSKKLLNGDHVGVLLYYLKVWNSYKYIFNAQRLILSRFEAFFIEIQMFEKLSKRRGKGGESEESIMKMEKRESSIIRLET